MKWKWVCPIRRAIGVAIRSWPKVADINFNEQGETSGAMVSISFGGVHHLKYDVYNNYASKQDPYPLDGPGDKHV